MSSFEYGKPLDVDKLKALIRQHPNQIAFSKNNSDNSEALFTLSLALTASVKKTFFELAEARFSQEPVIERKSIIRFLKCMRIDAMEKFNQTTAFSVIHYYSDVKSLEKNIPTGVIIVYFALEYVPEMLRLLKYPYIDYDDVEEVKDACGAIINLIAGRFKKEFIALGYQDMEMSHFKSFVNNAPDGIDFPNDQAQKYEISFHVDGIKRMVVEMIMTHIPKG